MREGKKLSEEGPRDLLFAASLVQNYKNVIWGREDASLRSMARPCAVPGLRPGDLLPREGRVLSRGQADLCRVPRPHRVPELRAAPRRALRRVGRDEREGTATPEAHGVLIFAEGGEPCQEPGRSRRRRSRPPGRSRRRRS